MEHFISNYTVNSDSIGYILILSLITYIEDDIDIYCKTSQECFLDGIMNSIGLRANFCPLESKREDSKVSLIYDMKDYLLAETLAGRYTCVLHYMKPSGIAAQEQKQDMAIIEKHNNCIFIQGKNAGSENRGFSITLHKKNPFYKAITDYVRPLF